MRILVTGGAGFIGAYVVRALLAKGYSVIVFDSLLSGTRKNLPEGVAFVQGDIRDVTALGHAAEGVDAFVHLAALVSMPESIEHPEETNEVNVIGAQNVFNLAARNVRRIVYASSAAVYGDLPDLPKRENSLLAPQSPYATSKVANELAAAKIGNAMGLRFFNVYGPGQRADHPYASVIPRFVAAAREGKPLTLTGDGLATRDFVHVRDVADAVVRALEVPEEGICNIASGNATSLSELVALIKAQVPIEVQILPKRPGDILHSVADVTRAREVLGFSAAIQLSSGIEELVHESSE